jgi:hypothetical protein
MEKRENRCCVTCDYPHGLYGKSDDEVFAKDGAGPFCKTCRAKYENGTLPKSVLYKTKRGYE